MRIKDAVRRNLYEVCKGFLDFKALSALDEYYDQHEVYRVGPIFFDMAQDALFNDMLDHLIKVLDDNAGSATFWSIEKYLAGSIQSFPSYSKEKSNFLRKLWGKLKLIRNKTHFHIDLGLVGRHEEVWRRANIKGTELKAGLEYLLEILHDAHKEVSGAEFEHYASVARYDGSEVKTILDSAGAAGVLDIREMVATAADNVAA